MRNAQSHLQNKRITKRREYQKTYPPKVSLFVGSPDIMASKTTTTLTSVNVAKIAETKTSTCEDKYLVICLTSAIVEDKYKVQENSNITEKCTNKYNKYHYTIKKLKLVRI